jgi:3',5'-cyclic AMP phosphodiesterase CpdA
MKIGFFSDLHCGREEITNGNRYPSRSLPKLQRLLADFENEGVDLAICLGDVVQGGASKADDIEHLSRAAAIMRDSAVPVVVMQGNHDFYNLNDDTFYRISDFVVPPFACKAGDVTLVFLDANYKTDGTRYGADGEHPNWKDTFIPEDQIQELRYMLQTAEPNARFWLLCHQCLDIGVEERHIVKNADEIISLISEEGNGRVEFVICGHYHPGAYSIDYGTEFITVPALCTGKDYTPDASVILDTSHKPKKGII